MALILPEHYDPHLDVRKTQEAIKYIQMCIRDRYASKRGEESICYRCRPWAVGLEAQTG